jgi:diamine N-acetyltransferase
MKLSGTDPKLVVNMISERIALGPLRSDLLPLYHRWINDFSTLRTLGGTVGPMTLEQEQAWIEAQITSTQRTHQIFTIYERESLQPIGTTSLEEIDDRHRTATFGILIGEATFRGRGLGTEVTRLMLDYAFTALGLHNVLLTVLELNPAGKGAYLKAGFHECGRRRQCRLVAGKWWDMFYMECLSTDFVSPWLRHVLEADAQPSSQGQQEDV